MQTPPKVNQKPGFSVQDPTGTHGRFDKETARVWLRHLARAFKSEGREIDWRGRDRFMVIKRKLGVTEVFCCRVVETAKGEAA